MNAQAGAAEAPTPLATDVERIRSEAELRALIGPPSAVVLRKKVSQHDGASRTFLAQTRLAILAKRGHAGQIHMEAICGQPGFATAVGERTVRLAGTGSHALDTRFNAASLFLIPGIDETVRLNGLPADVDGGVEIALDELFFHCPKAFVRSHLWSAAPPRDAFDAIDTAPRPALERAHLAFIAASPFLCLGTSAPDNGTDVSPRGDPSGFVKVVDDGLLLLPDRPGNRLLDNYRNILAHPYAAFLLFIPGVATTLEVAGAASLTSDRGLLERCAIDGKRPTVGLLLEVNRAQLCVPSGIEAAGIWDPRQRLDRDSFPSMGQLVIEQMEPNGRFKGLKARAVDALMRRDAKRNLY